MKQRRPKSGEFLLRPGETYESDAPALVDRFPARTELTVLSADDPQKPLGWTVAWRNGGEVFLLDERGQPIQQPLTSQDALREGVRVCAPTLLGNVHATVLRDKTGDLCWESAGLVGDLEYDTDDRHCWITTLAINKKLL
jgi:hypothetical protein